MLFWWLMAAATSVLVLAAVGVATRRCNACYAASYVMLHTETPFATGEQLLQCQRVNRTTGVAAETRSAARREAPVQCTIAVDDDASRAGTGSAVVVAAGDAVDSAWDDGEHLHECFTGSCACVCGAGEVRACLSSCSSGGVTSAHHCAMVHRIPPSFSAVDAQPAAGPPLASLLDRPQTRRSISRRASASVATPRLRLRSTPGPGAYDPFEPRIRPRVLREFSHVPPTSHLHVRRELGQRSPRLLCGRVDASLSSPARGEMQASMTSPKRSIAACLVRPAASGQDADDAPPRGGSPGPAAPAWALVHACGGGELLPFGQLPRSMEVAARAFDDAGVQWGDTRALPARAQGSRYAAASRVVSEDAQLARLSKQEQRYLDDSFPGAHVRHCTKCAADAPLHAAASTKRVATVEARLAVPSAERLRRSNHSSTRRPRSPGPAYYQPAVWLGPPLPRGTAPDGARTRTDAGADMLVS